jgi:uncharacterized Zn finger protein (UPF0148 family)
VRRCKYCDCPLVPHSRQPACPVCRAAHYGTAGKLRLPEPGTRHFPDSMRDLPSALEDGVRAMEDGDCRGLD